MNSVKQHPRRMLSVVLGVGSLVLLILSVPFVARTSQPTSQPQRPASRSFSLTPTIATSQTDPTAGWKLYEDEFYRYSVKYPPGWFLEPTNPEYVGKGGVATISSYKPSNMSAKEQPLTTIPSPNLKIEIGILSERKPTSESLDSWIASLPSAPPKEWVTVRKPVVVNGVRGFAIGITREWLLGKPAFSSLTVYVPTRETVLFVYSVPNPEMSVHAKIYELILDSVQLLP